MHVTLVFLKQSRYALEALVRLGPATANGILVSVAAHDARSRLLMVGGRSEPQLQAHADAEGYRDAGESV